jgi:CHAT domain-containing protein
MMMHFIYLESSRARAFLDILGNKKIRDLPFQALVHEKNSKDHYLIEDYCISYIPSASVLKYVSGKITRKRKTLLAAANPSTGLPELPGAELEATKVAKLFQEKEILVRDSGRESRVKRFSSGFSYPSIFHPWGDD